MYIDGRITVHNKAQLHLEYKSKTKTHKKHKLESPNLQELNLSKSFKPVPKFYVLCGRFFPPNNHHPAFIFTYGHTHIFLSV